jgi:leucine dehydrogenase
LFELPDFDAHEDVHLFFDPQTGLEAVIAVHSTHLGPAAGGARYWSYADSGAAVVDALRLSRGMSYKNAMAGLPMGGGKAVILKRPPGKTPQLMAALGRAIESLGGRYVTAEDVGVTDADMLAIRKETRHVAGLPVADGAAGGDPGPSTALGVFLGVEAAARHALKRDGVAGLTVAIQGVGSVGGGLARRLAAAGAHLILADIDAARAEALAAELGGRAVAADRIMREAADIFSPCALGAVLNRDSIPALDVAAVAGGANNQLATEQDGQRLFERGILYAPDYVINAGGIINVVLEYLRQGDADTVRAQIARIPQRLADIFAQSAAGGQPANIVADAMARALIGR